MLGYKHPDHMLDDLSASQLQGWLAWMRRYHPFPDRLDPYLAILLTLTHNQWCEKRDAKRPEDFMLYSKREDKFEEELTPDELRRRLGLPG